MGCCSGNCLFRCQLCRSQRFSLSTRSYVKLGQAHSFGCYIPLSLATRGTQLYSISVETHTPPYEVAFTWRSMRHLVDEHPPRTYTDLRICSPNGWAIRLSLIYDRYDMMRMRFARVINTVRDSAQIPERHCRARYQRASRKKNTFNELCTRVPRYGLQNGFHPYC